MDNIRILLVDDQEVVREGLRRMLEFESDVKVVGEASDAKEALTQVETLSPELILMDIKMPGTDGVELTRQVKRKSPDCNIIMLTLYDEYLTQAIEAGAAGYLLKDIRRDELIRAIRSVHEGRSPLNLSLSKEQLSNLNPQTNRQNSYLSERELAILHLIADGATNREIAEQIFLSEVSVKRSIRVIFEKLDVHNRSEAISEAYKKKLL
ncbi:response regulator [Chloroflexota bacterium]